MLVSELSGLEPEQAAGGQALGRGMGGLKSWSELCRTRIRDSSRRLGVGPGGMGALDDEMVGGR